jgi:hypothetical protein
MKQKELVILGWTGGLGLGLLVNPFLGIAWAVVIGIIIFNKKETP